MPVVLDRPPVGPPRRRLTGSVMAAWLALAASPAAVFLGLWLAFAVFGDRITGVEVLAVLLIMTVSPITALVLGVRAATAGSRSGKSAATVASVLLALIVLFVSRWAALVVVVAAVPVTAYWYRRQHHRPS